MTRRSCKFPSDCTGPARRVCGRCGNATVHAENIRRLNADPEFAERRDAAASERMRRMNADPEFTIKRIAGKKGVPVVEIPKWVPRSIWGEYLKVSAMYGEETAARHARSMKAELRA